MYINFEFVPLSEAREVPVDWDFDGLEDELDEVEELDINLALADFFEELLGA